MAAIAAARRPPAPWRGEDRFPWHDPEFSRRVLAYHLDPETPMASRAPDLVEQQVAWFHTQLQRRLREAHLAPPGRRPRVLDVGCGPGLYALSLARRGYRVTGLDIGPATLDHARRQAAIHGLDSRFLQADLTDLDDATCRRIGPQEGVAFWYGEFNSFSPEEIRRFLGRVAGLLVPGGMLLVEYVPADAFAQRAEQRWRAVDRSPFADTPHLWLEETHWVAAAATEVTRHWILDAVTGDLRHYTQCLRRWRDEEIAALLQDAGLVNVTFHPPVAGRHADYDLPVVTAVRQTPPAGSRRDPSPA